MTCESEEEAGFVEGGVAAIGEGGGEAGKEAGESASAEGGAAKGGGDEGGVVVFGVEELFAEGGDLATAGEVEAVDGVLLPVVGVGEFGLGDENPAEGGDGGFVDKSGFVVVGGLEFFLVDGDLALEFAGDGFGEDGFGSEAVFEGVFAGLLFAFGGDGALGFATVAAGCLALGLGAGFGGGGGCGWDWVWGWGVEGVFEVEGGLGVGGGLGDEPGEVGSEDAGGSELVFEVAGEVFGVGVGVGVGHDCLWSLVIGWLCVDMGNGLGEFV